MAGRGLLKTWWQREPTSEAIEWSVRRALQGDSRLRDFEAPRIRISAKSVGEVVISGAVSTAHARELAERVARGAKGVVALRSELQTDADLTTQLQRSLGLDPRMSGLTKDSAVFQGVAELRGSATDDAQLAAVKMTEAIDGVRGVANYMQRAASSQAADVKRAA